VVAQVAGAGGNVPAGAINNWPSNPCGATPAPNQVQTCSSADLKVSNPQGTSGGVDTHNVTVATADDVRQFQSQVDNLKKQLGDKVKQDMQSKAPQDVFAVDPTGQGLTVTTDVQPALPNPDDQYQQTNINVSAHGKAAMYNPGDVKKVINDDLLSLVPKNQQVATSPPPDTHDVAITQAGDDGTIIFNATETAFTQPVVDLSSLKDRFSGKTRSSVQQIVEQQFPGAQPTADVSQSIPFFVLPFFSSRIEIFISVHPPATTTPAT
jgi:hypothetical protein